jgi:hypothetical protein
MLRSALGQYDLTDTTPERHLLAAVVYQAIQDAIGICHPSPKVQAEARGWLEAGEADWICRLLRIDAAAIRKAPTNKHILSQITGRKMR